MLELPHNAAQQYRAVSVVVLGLMVFGIRPVSGQIAAEPEAYSAAELDELVGPIALYPDDLVGIVLPASTYPLQVVQAARFLEALQTDRSLKPGKEWDEAIIALLNYPEVVDLMNDDLDWTWKLGEAFLGQQADVVEAIERFRDRAYVAGNLQSDERQIVSNTQGVIQIEPVDPEVIYVPYYEPERVVVYQTVPVYHYHPYAYPVYYYPYPPGYRFASGFFWGVTTAFTVGWLTDRLHVHSFGHARHPYYGHRYYDHYYSYRSLTVNRNIYIDRSRHHARERNPGDDLWRPDRRHGARPGNHARRLGHPETHRAAPDWSRPRNDLHDGKTRQSRSRPTRREDARFTTRTDRRTRGRQATNTHRNAGVRRKAKREPSIRPGMIGRPRTGRPGDRVAMRRKADVKRLAHARPGRASRGKARARQPDKRSGRSDRPRFSRSVIARADAGRSAAPARQAAPKRSRPDKRAHRVRTAPTPQGADKRPLRKYRRADTGGRRGDERRKHR